MARHRLYVPDLARLPHGTCELVVTGPEAHHAVRVKRLGPDDEVDIFDGAGSIIEAARVVAHGRDEITILWTSPVEFRARPRPEITIAAPPVKGDRTEAMIEQLSQVGASGWIPLIVEYSTVVPRAKRVDKWRRLAIESAKQCGRAHVLDVSDPMSLADLLSQSYDMVAVADASGDAIEDAVSSMSTSPSPASVVMIVGAEGGLSKAEYASVLARNGRGIRLGDHVLRTETAATLAATALVWALRGTN